MAAQDLEGKVPSFKGFTLEKEDQLRDSANWENFRYKFNLEMSQKGVCDTFFKERSNNAEECKLFDKLWGTLGNNIGIMFRSILTEAKEKASANESGRAISLALSAFKSRSNALEICICSWTSYARSGWYSSNTPVRMLMNIF
jgi:hypothetical protein